MSAVERVRKDVAAKVWPSPRDVCELLALHDEALRVMCGLEDACAAVASWSEECLDYSDPARVAVRAFLAKAGGK